MCVCVGYVCAVCVCVYFGVSGPLAKARAERGGRVVKMCIQKKGRGTEVGEVPRKGRRDIIHCSWISKVKERAIERETYTSNLIVSYSFYGCEDCPACFFSTSQS